MSKICFYHYPCSDGITSVWAVIKAFPNIKYRGIKPQDDTITEEKYIKKDVIFVDVTPSEKILKLMLEKANSILILDHHISNQKIIEKYIDNKKLTAVFDMKRAGCQITWDHFFKTERPWFLDYVADRDLWNFELKDSKTINTTLAELDYITIDRLNDLYELTKTKELKERFIKEKILPIGKILDIKNEKSLKICISGACKRTMIIDEQKFNVWIASAYGYLTSELGNRLMYKKFPDGTAPHFVAIYSYNFDKDIWKISLRSLDIDVSVIASKFKGGGHVNASGFYYKGNIQELFSTD